MKPLILLVLVIAIDASWWKTGLEDVSSKEENLKAYLPGKEYVYNYESQVLTGIPEFSSSYAGFKVRSRVLIAFTSLSDAALQMTDIEILTLNDEILESNLIPPRMQLPTRLFSALQPELSDAFSQKLVLPVKFRIVNGLVTTLEISQGESNWSVNIKRAILGILQVRLQADDLSLTEKLPYNNFEDENSTTYVTLESGLDGTCHSWMQNKIMNSSTNLHKVTKIRNPMMCLKSNNLYKTTWSQTIDNCNCRGNLQRKACECKPVNAEFEDQQPGFSNARTVYEYDILTPDEKTPYIQKCLVSSEYRSILKHDSKNYIATYTNSTFILMESKSIQTIRLTRFSWLSISEPFKMELLDERSGIPLMTDEQFKSKVDKLIEQLITISDTPSLFENHLTVFHQLTNALAEGTDNQLQAALEDLSSQNSSRKRQGFVDALLHANHSSGNNLLLNKISSSELSDQDAVSIFIFWTADHVPTKDFLDNFSKQVLPALERKIGKKWVYQHALMCFGTLVRRFVHHQEIQKHIHVLEQDKMFFQNMINASRGWEKAIEEKVLLARSDEDKISLLKALANMASLEALPLIQNLLARSESTIVRVHAVHSLRHFCVKDVSRVLQTLRPLYLSGSNEESEIKMAAFVVVMNCDASITQLHKLIDEEKDLAFKTFVVKFLQARLHGLERQSSSPRILARQQKIRDFLQKVKVFQLQPEAENIHLKYDLGLDGHDGDLYRLSWIKNTSGSAYIRAFSFQHDRLHSEHVHSNFELGYRAEGLEQLLMKLKDKTSDSNIHPDLKNANVPGAKEQQVKNVKPSITFYMRINDQHVSFWHLEEDMLTNLIRQVSNGKAYSFPVQIFKTHYITPQTVAKLQPNGFWMINQQSVHFLVIDVQGDISIKFNSGSLMPEVNFHSTKKARVENWHLTTQYAKNSFLSVGLLTGFRSRMSSSTDHWNASFSFTNRTFVMKAASITNDLVNVELDAATKTFAIPLGPSQVFTQNKDIKTKDHNRIRFSKELPAFKSIGLLSKVEGDVYIPNLNSTASQTYRSNPAISSIYKQSIKFSVGPDSSTPQSFELFLTSNTTANIERYLARTPKETFAKSKGTQWGILKWFGLSNKKLESSNSDSRLNQMLSLGDRDSTLKIMLSSSSSAAKRSIVANWTTKYDQDFQTIRDTISIQRPPIPKQEFESQVFSSNMTRYFSPHTGEILFTNEMMWGQMSDANKPRISVIGRHSPSCIAESSFYGCKDKFGGFQPVWNNDTVSLSFKNADNAEELLKLITRHLMTYTESVFITPRRGNNQEHRFNYDMMFKPLEGKFDVSHPLEDTDVKYKNVQMPFIVGLENLVFHIPFYKLGTSNEFIYALSGRDVCSVGNGEAFTFDRKNLMIPDSECEVVLAADCKSDEEKQRLITYISTSSHQGIKVILGPYKIEILLSPSASPSNTKIQVKLNGKVQAMDNNRLLIQENNLTEVIIHCDTGFCELKSFRHKVYVRIDARRVQLEVDSDTSRTLCGLCSRLPEQGSIVSDDDSLKIYNQNRMAGEMCNIQRLERTSQQCTNVSKAKLIYAIVDDDIKICATAETLPLCSKFCYSVSIRKESVNAKCISLLEANSLNLHHQIGGDELSVDDERLAARLANVNPSNLQVLNYYDCK